MDQRFRRGFTAAEKTELWDRWQRGESLKAIGRAFGKPSSSIYHQVAPHGGIRPAARRRSRLALTLPEREEISRGIAAHQSASLANARDFGALDRFCVSTRRPATSVAYRPTLSIFSLYDKVLRRPVELATQSGHPIQSGLFTRHLCSIP